MSNFLKSSLGLAASSLALSLAVTPVSAVDADLARVTPLKAASFDIGSKHALAYFVADAGQCQITLMVTDIFAENVEPSTTSARFTAAAPAGRAVRLDTGEGKSLKFTCGPAASVMGIQEVAQLAWSAGK